MVNKQRKQFSILKELVIYGPYNFRGFKKRLGQLVFFRAYSDVVSSLLRCNRGISCYGEQVKETILDPQRVSTLSIL